MDDERYFAGCALQALISMNSGESPEKIAKMAFRFADAMIKERESRRAAGAAAAAEPSPFAQSMKKAPRPMTETELAKDAKLEEYRKNKPRF